MIKAVFLFLFLLTSQKALSKETEGSFSMTCSHCESKDPQFNLIQKNQACLQLATQEECQSIPKEERKSCTEKDNLKLTDTGSILYQCVEKTLLSYRFIFDFLWYIIQSSKSWLFEDSKSSAGSPAKNYIFTEFYRAYKSSKGSRLQKLLKAASIVGGDQFNLFWSSLKSFIEQEFVSFKCYKSSSQISIGCSFLLSYVVPGSGVAMLLKKGVKAGTSIIKHSKTTTQTLAQKRSLNALIQDMESSFDSLKQAALKSAKNLKRWEKKEIKIFFDKVDKNQFLSGLRATLNKKVESGVKLNRKQIQPAVVSSLTAGTSITAIKLSAKAAIAISEGVVDALATKYVEQNVIQE